MFDIVYWLIILIILIFSGVLLTFLATRVFWWILINVDFARNLYIKYTNRKH